MKRIASFDPGGTTGVAVYEYVGNEPLRRLWTTQLGPKFHYRDLWDWLLYNEPEEIVCESFLYRSHLDKAELVSNEYIGIIKLYAEIRGTPMHMQPASQGKATGKSAFWNVEKLKQLGLYIPARPHAMDALSHLLYHITFTRENRTYLNLLRSGETPSE